MPRRPFYIFAVFIFFGLSSSPADCAQCLVFSVGTEIPSSSFASKSFSKIYCFLNIQISLKWGQLTFSARFVFNSHADRAFEN